MDHPMKDGNDADPASGLAGIISELPGRLGGSPVTLGKLLSVLGEKAIAVVLLVFSIPAIIPTPGIPAGMIFGTALALLSLQLLSGADRFTLPARLARAKLPQALFERMAQSLGPRLSRLEALMKPRWHFLCGRQAMRPLGLVVLVMSVLIALPIPFGNVLPGISIFLVALGIAQRDGLAIGGGLVFALAAIVFSGFIFWGGWYLISDWIGLSSPAPSAG